MDKKELRNFYISKRDTIPVNERKNKCTIIAEKLFETSAYNSCSTLLIYVAVGSEVETKSIIDRAISDGKTVAVPYIVDRDMNFAIISSYSELCKGKFNIPTAPIGAKIITNFENTLCISPCVSVDLYCNRLGYGGGYYDKFLSKNNVQNICLCYDELICDKLPTEEFDIKINHCITDKKSFGGEINA